MRIQSGLYTFFSLAVLRSGDSKASKIYLIEFSTSRIKVVWEKRHITNKSFQYKLMNVRMWMDTLGEHDLGAGRLAEKLPG